MQVPASPTGSGAKGAAANADVPSAVAAGVSGGTKIVPVRTRRKNRTKKSKAAPASVDGARPQGPPRLTAVQTMLLLRLVYPDIFGAVRIGEGTSVPTAKNKFILSCAYPFDNTNALSTTNDSISATEAVFASHPANPWCQMSIYHPAVTWGAADATSVYQTSDALEEYVNSPDGLVLSGTYVYHSNTDCSNNSVECVFYDPESEEEGCYVWDAGSSTTADFFEVNGAFTGANYADYFLVLRQRVGGFEGTITETATAASTNSLLKFALPARAPAWVAAFVGTTSAAAPLQVSWWGFSYATVRGTFRFLPHYLLNGGLNSQTIIADSQRTNSMRATLTNVAAALYREGVVVAEQLPEGKAFTDYVYSAVSSAGNVLVWNNWNAQTTTAAKLASAQDRYLDQAVQGLSILWRPTTLDDVMFKHTSMSGKNAGVVGSAIQPVSFADVQEGVCAVMKTAPSTTVTQREGWFTVSTGTEIQSDNQVFGERAPPDYCPYDVEQVQYALNWIHPGSTNEGHLNDAVAHVSNIQAQQKGKGGGVLDTIAGAPLTGLSIAALGAMILA